MVPLESIMIHDTDTLGSHPRAKSGPLETVCIYANIVDDSNIRQGERREKVRRPGGSAGVFFPELFHRLPADTYRAVIEHLHEVFVRANHPVARWSVNAAASTHDPNSFSPNRPLGSLIKVLGGVGQGQVTFERVAVSHGIFRVSS